MLLPTPQSLAKIAQLIGARFTGNPDFLIYGINEIHRVVEGDLVFVDHPKYYDKALNSKATAILINKEVECPEGKVLLISNNPFKDFNKLTSHFKPEKGFQGENLIHPSAIIHPGVHLGEGVEVGEGSVLFPGVVLYPGVQLGKHVRVHANSVLGADAFYYQKKEGSFHKMHTCGQVVVEDYVEIGAGCTIDRGVTDKTIIGEGSKLDACVHIGHDTVVGKNCLIAAKAGVAGCVQIEDEVTLWGQVGVPSNITVKKGTVVLGQGGLTKSTEEGKTYFGSPAQEARAAYKEMALIRKLPKLLNLE